MLDQEFMISFPKKKKEFIIRQIKDNKLILLTFKSNS